MSPASLRISEELNQAGALVALTISAQDGHFSLREADETIGPLSPRIISGVMQRYARPLEEGTDFTGPRLSLSDSLSLCCWRYRASVDLEPKLYLVLEETGAVPIAALSKQIANALRFLCRQDAARQPG